MVGRHGYKGNGRSYLIADSKGGWVCSVVGGEAILQPCSPCPIYDYKGPEARSGKYFLLVHNTFDFNGLTSYQNRGTLYKLDGEYVEGAHQPIWFTDKGIFSPRDTGNSFYTSYTAQNGRGVLWFGDQKFYLFGRILEK